MAASEGRSIAIIHKMPLIRILTSSLPNSDRCVGGPRCLILIRLSLCVCLYRWLYRDTVLFCPPPLLSLSYPVGIGAVSLSLFLSLSLFFCPCPSLGLLYLTRLHPLSLVCVCLPDSPPVLKLPTAHRLSLGKGIPLSSRPCACACSGGCPPTTFLPPFPQKGPKEQGQHPNATEPYPAPSIRVVIHKGTGLRKVSRKITTEQ